jgi:hypothetical protein
MRIRRLVLAVANRTRFNAVGHTQGRPDYKTTTVIEPIGQDVDSWLAVDAP